MAGSLERIADRQIGSQDIAALGKVAARDDGYLSAGVKERSSER